MNLLIALHFENLRLFIAQYIIATLGGILIYYYLGRGTSGKAYTVPILRRIRYLGTSEFWSPLVMIRANPLSAFTLRPALFNDSLVSFWNEERFFTDLSYYFSSNGYPSRYYESPNCAYVASPVYEGTIINQIYKVMVAISAWAGILLLITPFSYIYVFLPHFPDPYNIIVAIVLVIAIFEGLLSTVFFRLGVTFVKVAMIESIVIIGFTFSLLSPSMSWIDTFSQAGRLYIYLILLAMFVAITALISQLRTKRNLFLSSFIFSTIAYFAFVGIVLYNVILFL